MDDSGERKQYSKTGIFGRIYQHSTTREQKAFTLNHHHTTTSGNSRLSKNTPRPRIRVLPETKEPGHKLGGCMPRNYSDNEIIQVSETTSEHKFFKQHKGSRPSNFLFQIARGSGATLSECNFNEKLHPPKKNPDIGSEAARRETTRMMV